MNPNNQAPGQPGQAAAQAPVNPTLAPVNPGAITGGPQPGQPKPAVSVNPNSTQNTLQVAEVRDGIVIMADGSFRAVVMCKAINFDLMSPQEKEGVEYAYQGFLNSLYFDIQISVKSRRVDVKPYLEKLTKIRREQDNMLLGLLMEDYIYFLEDLTQQTNIMDKMFYVTIPYYDTSLSAANISRSTKNIFANIFSFNKTPDKVTIDENALEQAKTELRNRVQAIMQGLQACGVQSLPLDTEELIELYYDSYNPDTATRQKLKNFGGLSQDVIGKGDGVASTDHLNRSVQ
ncbi:MAG: hypothetical protein AAF413_00170 [Patescibacteria group bacterium]